MYHQRCIISWPTYIRDWLPRRTQSNCTRCAMSISSTNLHLSWGSIFAFRLKIIGRGTEIFVLLRITSPSLMNKVQCRWNGDFCEVFLKFKVCRFGISVKLYDITFRILKALPFTLLWDSATTLSGGGWQFLAQKTK